MWGAPTASCAPAANCEDCTFTLPTHSTHAGGDSHQSPLLRCAHGPSGSRPASPRSPKMPIAAWAAVPALALLCLALAGWQYYVQTRRVSRLHDPWNSGELDLPALRSLGERAAKKYGGLTGMGTPTARSAYAPVDWARVAESCAPRGGNATRGGGRVVFVTGAAGFIGMHTCVALRRRGDAVVGLDNFNDYYPVQLKRARQAHAASLGVYIADGDINDAALMARLFAACRPTHVVHMAAQAGVRHAASHPLSYVHSNLAGHVGVLEAVRAASPPPALIFASSSSVYGLNAKLPFSEGDRVDAPASLYAATKRADELLAHAYHNVHGLDVTALRFFTVFGPWGRPDMAAFKFAAALATAQPIPVFRAPGGAELSRDFTYIDDITAGVLGAVDTSPAPPAPHGRPAKPRFRVYNLGNTHPHTVSELVDALEARLGVVGRRVVVRAPPAGDVLATYADIAAAAKDLGYRPQTALKEGVRAFSDWFSEFFGPEGGPPDVPHAYRLEEERA